MTERTKYPRAIGKKHCKYCETVQDTAAFSTATGNKDGLHNRCRSCLKTYQATPRQKQSRDRSRNYIKYGITSQELDDIWIEQDKKCAICKCTETGGQGKWHTDHVHGSAPTIVRGILCSKCNTGLGMLGDSATVLRAAALYLEAYGTYSENPLDHLPPTISKADELKV